MAGGFSQLLTLLMYLRVLYIGVSQQDFLQITLGLIQLLIIWAICAPRTPLVCSRIRKPFYIDTYRKLYKHRLNQNRRSLSITTFSVVPNIARSPVLPWTIWATNLHLIHLLRLEVTTDFVRLNFMFFTYLIEDALEVGVPYNWIAHFSSATTQLSLGSNNDRQIFRFDASPFNSPLTSHMSLGRPIRLVPFRYSVYVMYGISSCSILTTWQPKRILGNLIKHGCFICFW